MSENENERVPSPADDPEYQRVAAIRDELLRRQESLRRHGIHLPVEVRYDEHGNLSVKTNIGAIEVTMAILAMLDAWHEAKRIPVAPATPEVN